MIRVGDRAWRYKKSKHDRELARLVAASPVLKVIHAEQGATQWRALVCLELPTLVEPRRVTGQPDAGGPTVAGEEYIGGVRTVGPTVLDICYDRSYVANAPKPWEIVSIPYPDGFYHPNADEVVSGLCLGKPQAGISLESIIHLAYSAVTLNSANVVEWEGLNKYAASFVREHASAFPLVETGLTEAPSPDRVRRLENHHEAVFEALIRKGVIQCR